MSTMLTRRDPVTRRVATPEDRAAALEVLRCTYRDEKRWVCDETTQLPPEDLGHPNVSWFLARREDRPVGVLRVLYEPPLELYAAYGLQLVDPTVDVAAFARAHRVAEVGRFAVVPDQRGAVRVVAGLMRGASHEAVARGCTHLITDVFEGDPHSPYEFHTRVMGFQVVAHHASGELAAANRRITLLLDLAECYRRLRASGGWLFRFLTEEWDETLHRRWSDCETETGGGPSHPRAR
jgi:hypothetical protein